MASTHGYITIIIITNTILPMQVCRMLRSSQPMYLKVDRSPDGSELDHRHKLQMKLLVMCRRCVQLLRR